MVRFIKNGLRILADYGIALLIFVVFLYVVINFASNNLSIWLILYSIFICLVLWYIINLDMRTLAIKEKRPQNSFRVKPYYGFIYGLIGLLPLALLEVIAALLVFPDEVAQRVVHYALQSLMGPVYFIVKAFNSSFWGYLCATLSVAVMAGISYLLAFYDIRIGKLLGISRKPPVPQPNDQKKKSSLPYMTHPWYKK